MVYVGARMADALNLNNANTVLGRHTISLHEIFPLELN